MSSLEEAVINVAINDDELAQIKSNYVRDGELNRTHYLSQINEVMNMSR